MKTYTHFSILLLWMIATAVTAQNPILIKKNLNWSPTPIIYSKTGATLTEIWKFEGAVYNATYSSLPLVIDDFPINSKSALTVELINPIYEPIELKPYAENQYIKKEIYFNTAIVQEGSNYFGNIEFIPIRKTNLGYEKLITFELSIKTSTSDNNNNFAPPPPPPPTYTSVLSDCLLYTSPSPRDS